MIEYKCLCYGKELRLVDAKYTSLVTSVVTLIKRIDKLNHILNAKVVVT